MKHRFGKSTRIALMLSFILHIVLMFVLVASQQKNPGPEEGTTHVDITKIYPKRRTKLTPKHNPRPLPEVVPVKMKRGQRQVAVAQPVPLPPATVPFTHENPELPQQRFTLPAPRVSEIGKPGVSTGASITSESAGGESGTGEFVPKKIYRPSVTLQMVKPPVEDILPDIGELMLPDIALVRIGERILANNTTGVADIVFVIDASGSMKDNINAIRDYLNKMTDLFEEAELDFTLGVVIFRDSTAFAMLGWDFEVIPQTRSVAKIKRSLARVKCRGGEKTMDALVRAADEITPRQNAKLHFILVTDEYVSGSYAANDVYNKIKDAKIQVDVIGRNEPFQKFIARSTGGLWIPISSLGTQ